MLHKLSKGLDAVENFFAAIGGILLLGGMFIIVLEVLSTYFFKYSILWVNEISEYILLYIPFLGGAWLLRLNGHVKVDILEQFFSSRFMRFLDIIICLIGILISTILIWYGWLNALDNYIRGVNSLTLLEIPQVYIVIVIPVGGVLFLLEFVRKFYKAIVIETVPSKENVKHSSVEDKGGTIWNGG